MAAAKSGEERRVGGEVRGDSKSVLVVTASCMHSRICLSRVNSLSGFLNTKEIAKRK